MMSALMRRAAVLVVGGGIFLIAATSHGLPPDTGLPAFGRDTVLVWRMENQEEVSQFVVRIAQFLPDRFIEWENSTTQGTIFMTQKAVTSAKSFVNTRLFEGGVDTRGKDATTLWLSERLFRDLKERKRIKMGIDSVDGWMTVDGFEQINIEVNRATVSLPVMKVKDDRGSERWFLDLPDNPLLAKHTIRGFTQTLSSITTDKPNTLRWIKGKKLTDPRRFQ
jgi:hypothetical protein